MEQTKKSMFNKGYLKAIKEIEKEIDQLGKTYTIKQKNSSSRKIKRLFRSKLLVIKEMEERLDIMKTKLEE